MDTALDLIVQAHAVGLDVQVDGDSLLVKGAHQFPELVAHLRMHKAGVLAALKEMQVQCSVQDPLAAALGESPEQSLEHVPDKALYVPDPPEETDVPEAPASRPWWLDALPASWLGGYCRQSPTRHHVYAQLRTANGVRVCIECNQPKEPEEVGQEGAVT